MEGIKQSYRNITQYRLSLRFFVLHDYYVNGWCPDFSFQPTAETLEKLRNFRFKYRNLENGIELALDMHHDFSNPIFQQEQIFNFTFRNNNPFFLQFTDMPFVSSGMMLFDTSEAHGESLHEGSTIQAQHFMKTGKDGLNGVLRVRHQPAKPLWGEGGKPYQYYIRFGARKVKLRYIFYGTKDLMDIFSKFIVEESDNMHKIVTFGSPNLIQLKNGEPAFECTSKQEIAMKNLWNNPLIVKREKGNGTPFDYRKTLPYPKPDGVKYDETINGFVTEIFVKL